MAALQQPLAFLTTPTLLSSSSSAAVSPYATTRTRSRCTSTTNNNNSVLTPSHFVANPSSTPFVRLRQARRLSPVPLSHTSRVPCHPPRVTVYPRRTAPAAKYNSQSGSSGNCNSGSHSHDHNHDHEHKLELKKEQAGDQKSSDCSGSSDCGERKQKVEVKAETSGSSSSNGCYDSSSSSVQEQKVELQKTEASNSSSGFYGSSASSVQEKKVELEKTKASGSQSGFCGSEASPAQTQTLDLKTEHTHDHDHDHSGSSYCGSATSTVQGNTLDVKHEHSHSHDHDHAHDHAHSGCCAPTPSADKLSNPVLKFLARVAENRLSLRLSLIGLACFCAAFAAQVFVPTLVLAKRIPLLITLAITGIPTISEVALQLTQSLDTALNVNFLMMLAVIISALSGALFEAALLTTLCALSFSTEEAVSQRARRQLDALTKIAPSVALKLQTPTDPNPVEVPLNTVTPEMLLLVRVGQPAPADGVVVEGAVNVSLAQLTGEAVPAAKQVGDAVPAGAVPQDVPLILRVTRRASESFLARIARLVTDAQANRPPVSRFFDRFGALYARIVLIASISVAALLPLLSRLASMGTTIKPIALMGSSGSLVRGLGVLVTGAPCALLIGAPVAYLAALSAAARRGVLIKGGARAISAAAAARHAVFDKTGTLTTGQLRVVSTVAVPSEVLAQVGVSGRSDSSSAPMSVASTGSSDRTPQLAGLPEASPSQLRRALTVASALERGAVHPVAEAVRHAANSLDLRSVTVEDSTVVAGQGVTGVVSIEDDDGSLEIVKARIGRPSFILSDRQDLLSEIESNASRTGETLTVLDITGDFFVLRMRDELREEAPSVVGALDKLGMKISVLTGDASGAASYVGGSIGNSVHVLANASPSEKLAYVEGLRNAKANPSKNGNSNVSQEAGLIMNGNAGGALMVGDGVNDAAALAASLVGVACGLSTATAIDAADVVLVREDLRNVEWLVRKARATERVVMQNTVVALGLMVGSVFACAFGAVPLWLAVTLHEGGTILVGLNGLRLLTDRHS